MCGRQCSFHSCFFFPFSFLAFDKIHLKDYSWSWNKAGPIWPDCFHMCSQSVNPSCWPFWVCFAGSSRQDFRLNFWKRLICCPESRKPRTHHVSPDGLFQANSFFLEVSRVSWGSWTCQEMNFLIPLWGRHLAVFLGGPCEPWSLNCRSLHMLGPGDWMSIILPCGHPGKALAAQSILPVKSK